MYTVDPHTLARELVAERLREADRLHLGREFRRSQKPDAAAVAAVPAVQQARHQSRVWNLLHFRHAYS
jgi:hypothetical protein